MSSNLITINSGIVMLYKKDEKTRAISVFSQVMGVGEKDNDSKGKYSVSQKGTEGKTRGQFIFMRIFLSVKE